MTLEAVARPRWANAEHTQIDCAAKFTEIAQPIPFTASPDDVERHSRDLFARLVAGDFGPVADYVAPTNPTSAAAAPGMGPRLVA